MTWDNGSNSFVSPGIPPNPSFSVNLNKIVTLNMSYLIPTALNTYGVKYIFFDKTQLHPDWNMYDALTASGLKVISNNHNFTIFKSKTATEIQRSHFSVYLNSTSEVGSLELLSMFNSLGIAPAIINQGTGNLNITGGSSPLSAGSGKFYNSTEIATDFPAFQFNNFKGSYSGTSNYDKFPVGNGWNVTRFNGLYYVKYSANNNSIKVQKYDNGTGNWPESVFDLYYGNGSIPIPSGDIVVFHYHFTYSSNQNSGQIQFYGPQNSIYLQTNVRNKTLEGTFVGSSGDPAFSFGWALDKYNGSLTISNVNFTYSFQKNGLSNLKSISQRIQAAPNTNYTILCSVSNKSMHAYTGIENITSGPTGTLNYTLFGFEYLGGLAIIPSNYLIQNDSMKNIRLSISNGGSLITGTNNFSGGYLVNSYNPDYSWQTSKNLKYMGTNQLGQEIYYVSSNGNITFSIGGVMIYNTIDWAVAIIENMILPAFLFVPLIYTRNKGRRRL